MKLKAGRSPKAFTLIELLVVIAIIGLVATLSVLALNNARSKSRDAKRLADAKQIQAALEFYFDSNGRYPTEEEFNGGRIEYYSATAGTTTYMMEIPSAPTPADGVCTSLDNLYSYDVLSDGTSYSLDFCVSAAVGDLPSGQLEAFPGGIRVAASNPVNTCTPNCDNVSCGGDDGCGAICGCVASQECYNQICQTHFLQAQSYGGLYANSNYSIYSDGQYLYTTGNSSSTTGVTGLALAKINKDSLAVERYQAIYSPGVSNPFNNASSIDGDGQYLYVATTVTAPDNFGGSDSLIAKYNISDLSLVSQKYIGTTGTEQTIGGELKVSGDYLYLVSTTNNQGQGGYDAVIIKLDKDLNIVSQKVIGAAGVSYQLFHNFVIDNDKIYVFLSHRPVGFTQYDTALAVLDKDTLAVINSVSLVTANNESGHFGVAVFSDSILIASLYNISAGNYHALISKLDKSSLQLLGSKMITGVSGNLIDRIIRVQAVDNQMYMFGGTSAASTGAEDAWLGIYDPASMSIVSQWTFGEYGASSNENFFDGVISGDTAYLIGHSKVNSSYVHNMIYKIKTPFSNSTLATEPAAYEWRPGTLVQSDYTETVSALGLTSIDGTLGIKNSAFQSILLTPTDYGAWNIYY